MSIEQMIRQWRLVEVLSGTTPQVGIGVPALLEALGTSKATLYRDLETLIDAGLPVDNELRNNNAFYWLEKGAPGTGHPTPLQLAALRLARRFLSPIEGTRLVTQYDTFLARWSRAPLASASIRVSPAPGHDLSLLQAIDDAMFKRRRLEIRYESASGELGDRVVDPIELSIEQTTQVYLHAFDTRKKAIKTYKRARIKAAQVLDEPAEPHPEFASEDPFANAVKTWSAPPVDVEIRISARKARFVDEYPLKNWKLSPQPDGSVIVSVTVAGPQEISKWVLSWGRDAVVLSPPSLRQSLRDELAATLAGYEPAEPQAR